MCVQIILYINVKCLDREIINAYLSVELRAVSSMYHTTTIGTKTSTVAKR